MVAHKYRAASYWPRTFFYTAAGCFCLGLYLVVNPLCLQHWICPLDMLATCQAKLDGYLNKLKCSYMYIVYVLWTHYK